MTTWWSRMDEYACVIELAKFSTAYPKEAFQRFLEKKTGGGMQTQKAQEAFGQFLNFILSSIVENLHATVHLYDAK